MRIVDRYREVLSSSIAYSPFLLHSALSLSLSLSLSVSGVRFPLTICRVIEARDAIPAACSDFHGAPER